MRRLGVAIALALALAVAVPAAARDARGGGGGGGGGSGPRLSFPGGGGFRQGGGGGRGGQGGKGGGHHGHHHHHGGGSAFFFYGSYGPWWYPGWGWYRPYYYPYYPYYYPYYPVYTYPPYSPPWREPAGDEEDDDERAATPPPMDVEPSSYGLIKLDGVRDGASVELDGRFWLTARDLHDRWLALPKGEHRIAVRVGEGELMERTVRIVPGRTHVLRFDAKADGDT